jgi:hypothetical protein
LLLLVNWLLLLALYSLIYVTSLLHEACRLSAVSFLMLKILIVAPFLSFSSSFGAVFIAAAHQGARSCVQASRRSAAGMQTLQHLF